MIIINSFGDLPDYLENCKSVFIGKSLFKKFENNGGQSPIEAAKLGCKIYHGPYTYNFFDIYKILGKKKISKVIYNSNQLYVNLLRDLKRKKRKDKKITSKFMRTLEKKTLIITMRKVKKFLTDEVIKT